MMDSSNFIEGFLAGGGNGSRDNGGAFGGEGSWFWGLILLAFLFNGGWGGGFGGGATTATQGALTRGDLCNEFSFNDLQNGVRNVNDSVNLGFANLNSTICHQQYDTAMQTNAIQAAVNGGFSALNSTICQQQYDTASQLNAMNMANMQNANSISTQISDCCCRTQSAIDNVRFTISQEDCATRNLIQSTTRDMIDANNANTRAILDRLTAQEIAAKDAQIAAQNQKLFAAELAASQSAQNAYLINTLRPTAVPAYITCSPYASAYGLYGANGYGSSCGCGCGC